MVLVHYSDDPLISVRDAKPEDSRRDPYFKPTGLWVSVKGDQDWREWCESEGFRDLNRQHETQVVLAADANILHLKDEDDLDRFTDKYWLFPGRYRL